MKKTALIIMLITILSKIFGFARDITLSYFYGASGVSDAYLIALTIPSVIFGFIGTGLTTVFIPVYNKIEKEDGEGAANRYTNNLINIILLITTGIFTIAVIYTEPIVNLFAIGFEGSILDLTVKFTQISLVGMFFAGAISIFIGYLQIKGSYVIPTLIGFPLNILIILFIFLSSKGNIILLSLGTVIATASQLIFLIPYVRKSGFKYHLELSLKDKYIKHMLYIAIPVILGTSVNQINVLVDRTLASSIEIGGISALNYANKLNLFVQGLFVTSILSVMYPMISKMVVEDNLDGLKKTISEAIISISIFVLPATTGAIIFAEPIVTLLFGRGAFDHKAITMTAEGLRFFSIGMIGYALRDVLSRAFYALNDTKTPMINAVIGMTANILLSITLSKYMGIEGLALATSISAIFTTILMFRSLKERIGPFATQRILISFLKISFTSLLTGLVAKYSFDYLSSLIGSSISLAASIVIGIIFYFIIILFIKIDDFSLIVNKIIKNLGNRIRAK